MPDYYDSEPTDFDQLADDLAEGMRMRERRELAKAFAGEGPFTDDDRRVIAKAGGGSYRPTQRPAGPWELLSAIDITHMQKSLPFDDRSLERKCNEMLATEKARLAANNAAARERSHAARVEAHRALVKREIPRLLQKSMDLMRAGKITALDVAKIQSECIHLNEKWL